MQINQRDPYLTTHPLTPERISGVRGGGGALALRQHAGHAADTSTCTIAWSPS